MMRMLTLFGSLAILAISGCIEKDFDVPPVQDDTVELETNANLADLKEFFMPGEFVEITEDLTVDAIVIADDEAGNFYKRLVLQDETGGIEIQLNQTDLYTSYEEGRQLFIKAQGLYISDYNGLIQLGAAPTIGTNGREQLGRIEASLIEEIVARGPVAGVPAPREVSIAGLTPADISTLVRLCDVQFTATDTSGQLADVPNELTLNKTLEDCDFNTLIVRTSSFADLGSTDVPNCGGCLTGVYSVFGDDRQVFLRDEDDLDLAGPRCDGSECGAVGSVSDTLSVQDLRGLGDGAGIPGGRGVVATVISDRTSGTTNGQNIVAQGVNGYGIIFRFTESHTFNEGDRLFINVGGRSISEFNGGLQISDLPLSSVVLLNANRSVGARTITIADLLSDFERYESTLVNIEDVSFSTDDGDWAFGVNLDDGTATIEVFTSPGASFANDAPPATANNLIAYVSDYNGPQLILRSLNDLDGTSGGGGGGGGGGGNGGSPMSSFTQDFQSQTDYDPVSLSGWTNYTSIAQGRVWQARDFSGNLYAQATAFRDDNANMDTWLITPPLALDDDLIISFETATAFNVHSGLEVVISTDYSGTGNPASATWTSLGATIANSGSGDNTWVESGDVSLADYQGTGYVAFHYTGAGGGNTSTFRVDNVVLRPQ